MAINPALLVQADILQDYFVDKTTGGPLSGGILTFYQDRSRTTLKNVYYQTGSPGAYSYIPFTNPLILSGYGTIQDNNGNDVIPFYYPYDENSNTPVVQTYYVTAYSSNADGSPAVLQWTRQNFPLTPSTEPVGNQIDTNKNYIINKEFWRNVGSMNVSSPPSNPVLSGFFSSVLAPSQHDGFSMPDVQFFKNSTDATDTISFSQFVAPSPNNFPDQVLTGDVTPEFYMNLNCTAAGTETSKYVQFPLSYHVKSLSGAMGTITFQGQNVAGNANNKVTVSVMQYLGQGLTPNIISYMTFTLTAEWTKYFVPIILPSAQNLTLSATGDDALYLQINYPTAVTCDINIAMPSFYLSENLPTNDFDTYDQVDGVVGTPRTGDIRTSLNSFYPYGWVPMNDGFISNSGATQPTGFQIARYNIDTWPLFNLLWQSFNLTPSLAAIYTKAGSPSTYGSSALNDWVAGKQIQLCAMLGRVIAGVAPVSTIQQAFTNSGNTITVANASYFGIGTPVMVSGASLPSPLVANTIYYATNTGASTLNLSTTQGNALAGVVITLTTNGSGNIFLVLGANQGSSVNVLGTNNLPAHVHNPLAPSTSYQGQGTGGTYTTTTSVGSDSPIMATTGTNTTTNSPVNNYQPTVFYNVFMKL